MWRDEILLNPKLGCCWALILVLVLTGCGAGEGAAAPTAGVDLASDPFPTAGDAPGWAPDGSVRTFDEETLFDLVNGQAEAFFAYGFERVVVRRYDGANEGAIQIEVWQLATPADAYGLFTANTAGAPAEGIGNDGDADPGRRLTFWQSRYFVNVRAFQETDNADLETFARFISSALPGGGERPALMGCLPTDGLVERGALFFHEEISIQNDLWLGGENLLGLGPETDGVLARYGNEEALVRLLLIEYPDAESASAARTALQDSSSTIDSHLVTADTNVNLLAAIFGLMDKEAARALVEEALK